jgi:ureidoacrylate peracid hydrolase
MHSRRAILGVLGAVGSISVATSRAYADATPATAPLPDLMPLEKELNPGQSALVVVDFQNAFAHKDGEHYGRFKKKFDESHMIDISVDLVKASRAVGIQVFHVTEAYTPDYRELDKGNGGNFHRAQLLRQAWKQGSFGVQLYEGVAPGAKDNDILLPNRLTLSGFGTNGLDYILKARGIRNVAVMGFTSDICCYATTLAAYDLGYRVYAIKDAMIGADDAASAAMMRYNYPMLSRVMTSAEFQAMFKHRS